MPRIDTRQITMVSATKQGGAQNWTNLEITFDLEGRGKNTITFQDLAELRRWVEDEEALVQQVGRVIGNYLLNEDGTFAGGKFNQIAVPGARFETVVRLTPIT